MLAKVNDHKKVLEEEALAIRKERYTENPERWAKHYANSLNNLAITYDKVNRGAEAITLHYLNHAGMKW
jgi:hypothetical protein